MRLPRVVSTVARMSDPTNPTPPSSACCGPAIDDATRVAVAKAHCAIYRERCSSLESELDDAYDEINAHREFHENDLTREHRDLIRSQALAMLSAETRIAAASSALATFCAIGEPFISRAVDNATDYIVKALRGAGESIGRAMDDPDVRAGFVSSLVSSFVATSGINLDDLLGSSATQGSAAPPAPSVYPPKVGADPAPAKPASPIATPGDTKPASGVTTKKRATKRRA